VHDEPRQIVSRTNSSAIRSLPSRPGVLQNTALPPSQHVSLPLPSKFKTLIAYSRCYADSIICDDSLLSIMAIASQVPAITGKLRKRLILDLTVALGGGTAAAYGYW
jgi:hypothetical protein